MGSRSGKGISSVGPDAAGLRVVIGDLLLLCLVLELLPDRPDVLSA